MSALAQYFKYFGYNVAGYDINCSKITDFLINKGIDIHFEDEPAIIPSIYKKTDNTLVVYTPAVPTTNKEFDYFQKNNFQIKKRAEVLGILTNDNRNVAIAGTHGKTTTSSFITHIFNTAEILKAAFVGGVMKNYNSNFIINPQKNNGFVVLEADEYDRSFLQLTPEIAIINSVDPDHLDIYNSTEEFESAFVEFAKLVRSTLIVNEKVGLNFTNKKYTFGFNEKSDFQAHNIRQGNRKQIFDIKHPNGICKDVEIKLPGKINIENATAAFASAYFANIKIDLIKMALCSFQGTERRFDIVFENEKNILINDYAHHPTEIEGLANAVKTFFPNRKTTAIFQPHLYSRTRDFAKQFAEELSKFHTVILLPIYPARELPIEGVESSIIFDCIHTKNKYICTQNNLIEFLDKIQNDVVITIGAGNIDNLVPLIIEFLKNKSKKWVFLEKNIKFLLQFWSF